MKKSIFLFAMGIVTISANAQTVKEADVPSAIKNSLTKLHPTAKVEKWEKEGNNYEAEFTENKVETSVEFGPNGQLIATETEMKVSDLPKAVSDYFAKNMPGKKIAEASKIVAASGTVGYEAEVDEVDYIFDSNGTFVEKIVEEKDAKDDHDKK